MQEERTSPAATKLPPSPEGLIEQFASVEDRTRMRSDVIERVERLHWFVNQLVPEFMQPFWLHFTLEQLYLLEREILAAPYDKPTPPVNEPEALRLSCLTRPGGKVDPDDLLLHTLSESCRKERALAASST